MKAWLRKLSDALPRLALLGGVAALTGYAIYVPPAEVIALPLTPRPEPGTPGQSGGGRFSARGQTVWPTRHRSRMITLRSSHGS
jgi:hypothetical protein